MPADAPVISAVSAMNRSLFRNSRNRIAVVPGGVRTSVYAHAHRHAGGSGPLLGGRVPLGSGDPFLSGPAARARGRQPGADAVPARPRPDRALEGVPAP